jgi:hypothetical protein
MLASVNPEYERIRAQAILRSFTEFDKAVNLFAPTVPQGEHPCAQVEVNRSAANADGISIMRFFKAIRLNRRNANPRPQLDHANKRVTHTS